MVPKKPLAVETLWQIERIGPPSLAPDGTRAVAPVTRYSMEDNNAQSSLWLMSTTGAAPRQLTQCGEKDGTPRWSPARLGADGRPDELIAFTAKRDQAGSKDSESQLYLISPDGGEATRAAEVATGIEAFRWCPDGKRIVFVSWVWPELKGSKAQKEALKTFKERKESGYVTSEARYRFWDRNLPMGRVPHLHLMELGRNGTAARVRDLFEGTPYELSRAEPDASHFDISPDGKRIAFSFDPAPEKRPDGRFAIAELELRSGTVTVLAQDDAWDLCSPRYSPDGTRIALTASHQGRKHTMPAQLAIWDREDHAWEVVSAEWDHEPQAPLRWEADGQALLFTAEQKG
ncbi:MAG: S9 family peptidase, partial [Pseudomonadota bacterium]|nr:S9 family peptidase [Pseudomonadota bacterium]